MQDKKLAWYDLDLSTKPYRSLRYHEKALRGVAYHARHPLFASASDDGALHVFHGMVYQVRGQILCLGKVQNAFFWGVLSQSSCPEGKINS